ncbi:MAG: antitoxin VapB family protein [Candidatus Aenigmarchaeota archaeon]|nr:antitoxin VapB family protein [Candidatus Aenigmarchaeota archaeon]
MTIKSLTITEDAYDTLNRLKHGDESFSEVIVRIGTERKPNLDKYFGILRKTEGEVIEWQNAIKKRRKEIDLEFNKKAKKFKDVR